MAKNYIEVRSLEDHTNVIVKSFLRFDIEQYPELQGLSQEECKEYIKKNKWFMSAPQEFPDAISLGDAIEKQQVIFEKDLPIEYRIEFK